MKVILESPYSGNVAFNLEYARKCLKDSLLRGEFPIASHLLHTQVLDDTKKDERKIGIEAGLAWVSSADLHVFYVDHDMSPGMQYAYDKSTINCEFRFLYDNHEQ